MGSIFLDCFNNTGKKYLRIVEGYYFRSEDGKTTVKRRTIKNLGPLSRFDGGQGEKELLLRLSRNSTIFIHHYNFERYKEYVDMYHPDIVVLATQERMLPITAAIFAQHEAYFEQDKNATE